MALSVLIVEDDPDAAEVLASFLRKRATSCTTAVRSGRS